MRILHLADVHLDRPFAGRSREEGDRARARLREGFRRCLAEARERYVDLVTIGGDLWEDEHVTPDTRQFVAYELGKVGLPVLLVCGNHDPHLAGGNYPRTEWPRNVRVVNAAEPVEHRHGDVSVWGVSWCGGDLHAGFLSGFAVPDDGRTHLLLLHGTAQPVAHLAEEAHCPFDPAVVSGSGFALCLAGHVHAASSTAGVVYPGSPEPLGFGEDGRHCVALVQVTDGVADVELVDVAEHRYTVRSVDCTGARSGGEVADRMAAALTDARPETVHLRAVLEGEVAVECEVRPGELAGPHLDAYAELVVQDATRHAYDLDALAAQKTASGRFVRGLRERVDAAEGREREVLELALAAGLHAMNGRNEVVHVD